MQAINLNRIAFAILFIALAFTAVGCNRRVEYGPRAEASIVEEIRRTLSAPAPATEAAAETADAAPVGWATIKGKFTVLENVPEPAPLAQAKTDPACAKHVVVDESIVVQDGALVGAAIFARSPKLPLNPDLAEPTGDVVLDNKNCRFEPHVFFARTGQKVLVRNSDPFGHNTKIDSVANPSQNFSLPAAATVEHTFGKEELQPVKIGCSIHPWMGGWAIVRGNPYGGVSDERGSFVIEKVPAGREIEFQLWQEKAGPLDGVTINGGEVKVDGKGRFKLKLEPDQELALDISVPADALK